MRYFLGFIGLFFKTLLGLLLLACAAVTTGIVAAAPLLVLERIVPAFLPVWLMALLFGGTWASLVMACVMYLAEEN